MTPPVVVLYVSDDGDRDDRAAPLRRDDLAVEVTDSTTAADRAAAVDCVVCEAALDGLSGVSLVADLRERHPDLPVVLFPANGDERLASDAVSAGVSEYVRRTGEDAYDRLAAGVRRVSGERDDRSEPNGPPAPRGDDGDSRDRGPAADGTRHVDRAAVLSDLHAATRDLMAAESPAAIGEIVVETANEVLDLPITTLLLYEEASGRLEPVASTDEAVSLFGSIPSFGPQGESVAWRTFDTGEPTLYEDVREAGDVYDPDTPIRTELQIPLGDHGVLITGTTERRTFEDYFVDFAQLLVANAEVALERARRVELLQRRERELRESEERFRTIAEHIDSEVWMTDSEKTELYYVSPRHEDIWGQDLSVGDSPREILDYIHDDDREEIREAMREQADGKYDREYRIEHPEKGTRWVHARAFPIREDGEVTRVVGITDDVTGRKRRERELERYERIFETVRDQVYVLDEDGRFMLVNDPLLSMLGYDRSELLGSHVSAVVGDDAVERALLADGGTAAVTVETEIAAADGERIPCEVESATLTESNAAFRGSVGVVRDISDRKQVKAELERQRDRLSALFENIPDPVARTEVVDGKPIVREVNRAFERVFGYDADEIVGESINGFVVPPNGFENATELDEKTISGERIQEEVRRQTDSGIRHFLLRGVPIEVDDGVETVESYDMYTDITDQKTRERRLQVLNRVLRHNMRNDMNVISGHAETLDRDADGGYVETAATAIEETANEVARLSDRIRDIEQTLDRDAGVRRRVELAVLVDGLVDPFRESDAVDLAADVPPDLGVKADERLSTALEYLIDNAVEHSDRATPSVRIAAERVGDGWVDVEIRDDGPGIPLAERDVLTGDREITQLEHGSGLGLWLVNWIATSLGGDVRFDDNVPRGSVVTVRLQSA